ncbi:hypothetical protein [Raoultella ornithinolytica]|uniref:hypothetical protein n=1 Tax=Raoultella ornithinolytica TaxID=54291 RepID=UPI000CA03EEF|nr:hypothetical protein [Raoultella ornithinolytica]
MNTRLSDLKNAVETMSKSDFNDYLIRLIENIEQTLANSSIYEDMEEKILFDKFYLFSLQIQDLDLSLHECKQNQLKIKSQIEQLKKESNKKLTTEQHTLSNHIEEIKNTLTDGCILPNLTNEDISKILVKIKKKVLTSASSNILGMLYQT